MIDKSKCSLLHHAAFKNDFVRLRLYIHHFKAFCEMSHGQSLYVNDNNFQNKLKGWINIPNTEGCVCLHFAALHGNIEMIKFLEEAGANLQYRSN